MATNKAVGINITTARGVLVKNNITSKNGRNGAMKRARGLARRMTRSDGAHAGDVLILRDKAHDYERHYSGGAQMSAEAVTEWRDAQKREREATATQKRQNAA